MGSYIVAGGHLTRGLAISVVAYRAYTVPSPKEGEAQPYLGQQAKVAVDSQLQINPAKYLKRNWVNSYQAFKLAPRKTGLGLLRPLHSRVLCFTHCSFLTCYRSLRLSEQQLIKKRTINETKNTRSEDERKPR